jgi:hypothetical protein
LMVTILLRSEEIEHPCYIFLAAVNPFF